MNRYIAEEYSRIPDLHSRLEQAARRERSRAIGAALASLWRHAKAQFTPRAQFRPSRWVERLG